MDIQSMTNDRQTAVQSRFLCSMGSGKPKEVYPPKTFVFFGVLNAGYQRQKRKKTKLNIRYFFVEQNVSISWFYQGRESVQYALVPQCLPDHFVILQRPLISPNKLSKGNRKKVPYRFFFSILVIVWKFSFLNTESSQKKTIFLSFCS